MNRVTEETGELENLLFDDFPVYNFSEGRAKYKKVKINLMIKNPDKRMEGFTLIEALVVVAIVGILAMSLTPAVLNSLETRRLESEAREILTSMEKAKFQAVKTKLNHRVRFYQQEEKWIYVLEREDPPGTWSPLSGAIPKPVFPEFAVTVDLPGQQVEFSSLGMIGNYDSQQNTVTLQSLKLYSKRQPDLRKIWIYGGGSIRYEKSESGV
jgi:prepilin-type N-terminal cleavage/methylation domain-containing protein